MKKYFIETSVIVGFLRNRSEAVHLIEDLEGELVSSYVCLAELYEGISSVADREQEEQGVLDFFAGLSEVYGLDEEIAKQFGQIRGTLKKRGEVIEDLDMLLAATCTAYNFVMVTFNKKHFERIEGLEILAF